MTDNIPSKQEFLEIINASEALSIVVRGHQTIEKVLNLAISEALAEPHVLEVSRLNFALKVDLATALGLIPEDSRGTYIRINKIRNDFAHKLTAFFGQDEARELFNTLSPDFRQILGQDYEALDNELDVLRHCIAVLYFSLQATVSRMRDSKTEARILHEMVVETLGLQHGIGLHSSEVEHEFQQRITEARERRNQEGNL